MDFWNLLKFCLLFSLRVLRLSTVDNLGVKELALVSLRFLALVRGLFPVWLLDPLVAFPVP